MWNVRFLSIGLLLPLVQGCVMAHYNYSVDVQGATTDAPAVVQIRSRGRTHTFNVPSNKAGTTVTEVLQFPGVIFVDAPRGFDVRVSREGYKPWEFAYHFPDEEFASPKWNTFVRHDVVRLEPANSPAPSVLADGTPLYP